MKKIQNFAFFIGDGFESIEFAAPYNILKRCGAKITIYSDGKKKIISSSGFTIITDDFIKNLKISDYDALILPGGPGTNKLLNNRKLLNVVKNFNYQKKIICAICAATLILDKAEIITNDTDFTIYPTLKNNINIGNYHPNKIIEYKNLITAPGPGFAIRFGFKIAKKFYTINEVKKVQEEFLI